MKTKNLFSPTRLGPYTLKNRVVLPPLTRSRSSQPGDIPNELMAEYYAQRSSAGFMVTEGTQIEPRGQGYAWTPGIYSSRQVEGWKIVTRAVHEKEGIIFAQLWHVGRISDPYYLNGAQPVAPSPLAAEGHVSLLRPMRDYVVPRALETAEIPAIVEAYRKGAENAKRAGFDGVEIHGANGYLLQQFYSAASNLRDDEWGGSREKRMAFPLAVARAVADTVAASGRQDFIVGYRFSPEEAPANGIKMADTLALIDELVKLPLQYLHVSLGDFNEPVENAAAHPELPPQRIAQIHRHLAGRLPLVGVGGLVSAQSIADAGNSGHAELIAVGRGAIINPDFALKIAAGRENELADSLDGPLGAQAQHIPDVLWGLLLNMQPWVPFRGLK